MKSGIAVEEPDIHAAVDAYGYPVYLMISEGQRNDINYAILARQIEINGSNVLVTEN